MPDNTTEPQPLGVVRIEVSGRSDTFEPQRRELIEELPDYLRAAGIESDLFYKEPGGMGLPPLESITIYVADVAAAGLLGTIMGAAARSAIKWARNRLRREPQSTETTEERPVRIALYGPNGEVLKFIEVTEARAVDSITGSDYPE